MHEIRLTDPRAINRSAIRRRQRGGGTLLERTPTAMTGVRLVGSRCGVEGMRVASRAEARTLSSEELTRTTADRHNDRGAARGRSAANSPQSERTDSSIFSPPRSVGRNAGRAFVRTVSVPAARRAVRFPTPPNAKRG